MSGICLGPSAILFLSRYGRPAAAFSCETNCLQILRDGREPRVLAKGRRVITSWDSLYYHLRSVFDGYTNPHGPISLPEDHPVGAPKYLSKTRLLDVKRVQSSSTKVETTVQDLASSKVYSIQADFVIGANWLSSVVHAKYLPNVQRRSSGYVAWRGVVREDEISATARNIFNQGVTLHLMKRQHCVVYTIPGAHGSIEPGKRLLNFLWYTNEDEASMEEIMTDAINGYRHRYTVPAGHVRPEVWSQRVAEARRLRLPPPWLEVVAKIDRPFIQAISDLYSPRAVFEDGRVLLAGDALSQFCPHTGLSGSQAAFHSMRMADYISGHVSVTQLETEILG
jgi:2-polyprenyl-6-methoxyphenol hydroxylase-like FAD-dependent oxidoreductase